MHLLLLWQDQGKETGPVIWHCGSHIKVVAGEPGPYGNITSVVTVKSAARRLKELKVQLEVLPFNIPTPNELIYIKLKQTPADCKFLDRKAELLNH